MTEKYRFFDNTIEDKRQYNAGEFADYFGSLVTSGVFAEQLNALQVTADGTGLTTKMDTGKSFILGYYYENDAIKQFTHDAPDPTYNRIDRTVLELNKTLRIITSKILKGAPAASPVAPALTQNPANIYQIPLAQTTVRAGSALIVTGDVVDEREYAKYTSKPAWYPNQANSIPQDAWTYSMFKDLMTAQEKDDIEANPSLMDQINHSEIAKVPYGYDFLETYFITSSSYQSADYHFPTAHEFSPTKKRVYVPCGASNFTIVDLVANTKIGNLFNRPTQYSSQHYYGTPIHVCKSTGELFIITLDTVTTYSAWKSTDTDNPVWSKLASKTAVSAANGLPPYIYGSCSDGVNIYILTLERAGTASPYTYYVRVYKYNMETNTWSNSTVVWSHNMTTDDFVFNAFFCDPETNLIYGYVQGTSAPQYFTFDPNTLLTVTSGSTMDVGWGASIAAHFKASNNLTLMSYGFLKNKHIVVEHTSVYLSNGTSRQVRVKNINTGISQLVNLPISFNDQNIAVFPDMGLILLTGYTQIASSSYRYGQILAIRI